MSAIELRPCPFCGADGRLIVTGTGARLVYCGHNGCPLNTINHTDPITLHVWNTRPPEDKVRAQKRALERETEAAILTLQKLGYTFRGGTYWQPPMDHDSSRFNHAGLETPEA